MADSLNNLLVSIKSKGSLPPLYLVHSLAGELTWLPPLSKTLDANQPLYGFAAPGLNAKGQPFESIEDMAKSYLEATKKVHSGSSYILGGYSFGGVVAYEMARQVQARGEHVEKLILIDSYSPHSSIMEDLRQWNYDGTMLQSLGNMLALDWKARALLEPGTLPAGNAAGQVDIMARHLLDHCDIPHSYEALSGLLEKCRNVMEAHNKALTAYELSPLDIPVDVVLIHNTEGFVSPKNRLNLRPVSYDLKNNSHGWDRILSKQPNKIAIETEHFMMMKGQSLNQIGHIINAELCT